MTLHLACLSDFENISCITSSVHMDLVIGPIASCYCVLYCSAETGMLLRGIGPNKTPI